MMITDQLDPDQCGSVREMGAEASFTLSSAKPGNGIEQLRDNSNDTYWQSDGTQPHTINIQFLKKVSVSKLCLYLDFKADESYAVKKLTIKSGTCTHDLCDLVTEEIGEVVGWVTIPLYNPQGEDDDECYSNVHDAGGEKECSRKPLQTYFLQVLIHAMHQNGRDAHVRQLKVFGPLGEVAGSRVWASRMIRSLPPLGTETYTPHSHETHTGMLNTSDTPTKNTPTGSVKSSGSADNPDNSSACNASSENNSNLQRAYHNAAVVFCMNTIR